LSTLFQRIEFRQDGVMLYFSDGVTPPAFDPEEVRAAARERWEHALRVFEQSHPFFAAAKVSVARAAYRGEFNPDDCDPFALSSYQQASRYLQELRAELLDPFREDQVATSEELVALVNGAVNAEAVATALQKRLARDVVTTELRGLHDEFTRTVLCQPAGPRREVAHV
jgi:hypothetical protein